jgi:putative aminopeptidase FrvX
MKQLIKKLTDTFSPSGYEDSIRQVVRKEITGPADSIRVDALGNLIARKGKAGNGGKRIMLAAHMDEIGLMVSHVDKNGFVRFSAIGGVFGRYVLGSRVRFMDGTPGVIAYDRLDHIHEVPDFEKIYIDVGATSPQDCPVRVGDVAAFERPFVDMGRRMVAKSMDDRTGVAVLIETMRALKTTPHEVYFVFTTQEEVGTRGAATSAYGIDPEIGIAVDVTPTGDTPHGTKMEMTLGAGPAIKIKDPGMLADPRVVQWMIRTAEKSRIPYQREVLLAGSTDARAIQGTRSGVAAGCVSIPVRYVHSPSEMVDLEDIENCVRLLTALLRAPIKF